MSNRTLVIGASGNIGGEVVDQLSATGNHVRAMTRNPALTSFPQGVEIVQGDITLPETLEGPLNGIDSVFLVWTAGPDTIAPVVQRIARSARRIVLLTSPHKTQHPFFQQPNKLRGLHQALETQIEASGMEWTILRPGMLARNTRSWWAPQIRKGNVVRWPLLNAPTAPIHERDIAAVAIHALLEDTHTGAEYVLTGPQSLTQAEQVLEIGRALSRPLLVEEISPDEARQELLAIMPPFIIEMLLAAWSAAIGQPAYVTATVKEITGLQPRTLFDWATDHKQELLDGA